MYPELEAVFAALDAAQAEHTKAFDAAPSHDFAASEADCPRCSALKPSKDALRESQNAAWDALRGVSDPLVRWIVRNCWEFKNEALAVVRALPAPMGELDALASREGWCSQWNHFRDLAKEAGVLPAEVSADTEVSA